MFKDEAVKRFERKENYFHVLRGGYAKSIMDYDEDITGTPYQFFPMSDSAQGNGSIIYLQYALDYQ